MLFPVIERLCLNDPLDGCSLNEGFVVGYEEDRNAILLNCDSHLQPSKAVPGCLQACARLDYPRIRFGVIAMDVGGTTPLDEIIARFHGVLSLRLLPQENAGPAAARNRGGSEAKGEFLVFTDDDCSPTPSNWRNVHSLCSARLVNVSLAGQLPGLYGSDLELFEFGNRAGERNC